MKKNYVKPELQIQELLLEGVIATSDPEVTDKPVIPFTNKKEEGGWGRDLWGKKED